MRTQLVSRLLTAAPGIDTLTSLSAINPFDLPAAARIDYLSALERQISWLQAMMQRAIVAVAGEEGVKHAIGLLSEEIDRNMAMMGILNPSEMSMEYMRPMR